MGEILVIDDELAGLRDALESALDRHRLHFAESGRAGLALIEKNSNINCVLLDLRMPADMGTHSRQEGLAVLQEIKRRRPSLPVVMLTALPEAESAGRSLELGAFHYLNKPLDVPKLRAIVSAAIANHELLMRLHVLEKAIHERDQAESSSAPSQAGPVFGSLIGASPAMRRVFDNINRIAPRDISVLILGDSGTGKELVAREIHSRSARASGPFVPVNCASIPRELLESSLFGHKRGAFTGAVADRIGDFVQADGGTIFLDEIGDMPVELQAKLLRALQDQRVRPVGAQDFRQVDVRVISATNRDIDALVASGDFRSDLFYRLNVFRIRIPSLAERAADVPLLAEHFLEKHRARMKSSVQRISEPARELLLSHSWPGNVRELEHVIEAALAMADGAELLPDHVKPMLVPPHKAESARHSLETLWQDVLARRTPRSLVAFRNLYGEASLKEMMRRALDTAGDIRSAAALLGFLEVESDRRAYNNFRKWLSRLGVRRRNGRDALT